MAQSSYDLLVIGAGAAGSAAAHTAHAGGARVIQIERDKIGGTCLNYGCDPTKTLLHIAQLLTQARQSEQYGLVIPRASLEWRGVQERMRNVINQMRGGTSEEASAQLQKQGIEFVHGEARFTSPHEVAVNGRVIAAERIIIATGSQNVEPAIEGLKETGFLTNKSILELPELPRSLAIIGGGAIGIEFAQMFQRFGVEVTVIEKSAQILSKEDQALAAKLCGLLSQEGITLHTSAELLRVQRTAQGKRLTYRDERRGEQAFTVDEILLALGRRPSLESLHLAEIGVETSKRGIKVDETLRTSVPHIWAAGDITGGYKFTHVANEQGRLAAQNAFAEHPRPFDGSIVPWVTFSDPPLAHVGPTEEELRQQGKPYRVACMEFQEVERALTLGQTNGEIKLLADEQGHILGGHILGPRAGELIASVVIAMRCGMPAGSLAATLLPYPTLSEGVRWTAGRFHK